MRHKTDIWSIVSCQLNVADEEMFSWVLFNQKTLGLEISNIDEQTLLVKASFHPQDLAQENIEELRLKLKHFGLEQAANTLKIEDLPNQDWMTNWKKYFLPFTIANQFLICPPWKEKTINYQEFKERKKLIIDPGMAFGTGLHATTKYCLEASERFAKGPNIIDVGTGSGILSIACAILMPASHIVALDNDENSFNNAQHNFKLNHVEKQIHLEQIDLHDFCAREKTQFNTILSNLTVEVIVDFLPDYNKILTPGGIVILAGIIEERFALLEAALSKYPFKQLDKTIDRGWVGLTLGKD